MDKVKVLAEIKGFLEGYNNDLKYIVNVETDPATNVAECIVHKPNEKPKTIRVEYQPFMYMKDLSKFDHALYAGKSERHIESMQVKYGVKITKLKTGNQKRLVNGYCYKLTSHRSFNAIVNYLSEGGINPYEKLKDSEGREIRNSKGEAKYVYRELFHNVSTTEQFFISTQSRLFKGIEEYKNIHKFTFDIETTGLRYQIARIILIGVRDNRGFEMILEPDKLNDDEEEIKLIQKFFNVINLLQPAVVMGYNSEMFDFEFILGRAKLLKMDLSKVPTGLKKDVQLSRKSNTSVKYGNTADKFTATKMWGISVIDIMHAAKKTAAINSDLKETKLKYIAKHEKIARPNRTYIAGEDNQIGRFYAENKLFVIDDKNNHMQVPDVFQEVANKLYLLQSNRDKVSAEQYQAIRNKYLSNVPDFVNWFRTDALPNKLTSFIGGKKLVKNYLLDDLWETEQVDELYNQSSFLLAKIVPTTYQRVCTMGTAAIWNLLLTAWSYENDLAIPHCDVKLAKKFSGGLARCFKTGFIDLRIIKIDYASLYPMIQLTEDVFPMFDITGVMKKILLYLTTTRNIYKKLANGTKLNDEEVTLLNQIDHEAYIKYTSNVLTPADLAMFKIKQLPIKILNNSLFGALGSDISFNWSDNICAARITCSGRLHLRHAINWFSKYNCLALLAVTDGINFQYPEFTDIGFNDDGEVPVGTNCPIDQAWKFAGKTGINALIEKYNKEEMKPPYMAVDNDGESISCLNLARINYATLSLAKDKKTGEMKEKIKLTGNTIKSKIMPGYIEEFIDKGLELILHGKGAEFVKYYNDYADNLYYCQIPLKKIASKSKVKMTLNQYKKRGKDKNGRDKAMQAHMELLILQRNQIAVEMFEKHKADIGYEKPTDKLTPEEKMKLIINYMPPEPELDSVVYYVNTGTKKSEGNSKKVKNKETGEEEKLFFATLISAEDLLDNPNMTGKYNTEKYLEAFNSRVTSLLVGFEPEIAKKILATIVKDKKTKETSIKHNEFASYELKLKSFDLDDLDEATHVEEKEAEFWNKFGYNPKKIWDGFKMYDDAKVYYEVYEHALSFLNEKMLATGKPLIKKIDDVHNEGDLVLIKNDREYSLGHYNGVFVEIIRDSLNIPKSEIEIELDIKRAREEEKLKELEITLATKSKSEQVLEIMKVKREKYFNRFKKRFKLSEDMTVEALYEKEGQEDVDRMLDAYINDLEGQIDEEANEYADIEDSES